MENEASIIFWHLFSINTLSLEIENKSYEKYNSFYQYVRSIVPCVQSQLIHRGKNCPQQNCLLHEVHSKLPTFGPRSIFINNLIPQFNN